MYKIEEIRKLLYQVFETVGVNGTNKTRLVNFFSKPVFFSVLVLIILGSVFYVFPGLRTYIGLTQEKVPERVMITAIGGGVAIGGDNYGDIETNVLPKPAISFEFSTRNHRIGPDLYGAMFHFEIINVPIKDIPLVEGRRTITNDAVWPYLEKIKPSENLNCTILASSTKATLEMGDVGIKIGFDMSCTSQIPILNKRLIKVVE